MNILKNKYGEIRSGWDMLWVSLVILIVLQFVLAIPAMPLLAINDDTSPFSITLFINIISEIVYIVALLLIWKSYHKDNLINLGLSKKNKWNDLIIGLLLGIISIGAVFVILLLTNQIEVLNIDFSIILTPNYLLYLILFILVGIWEEMLSRGYYMSMLKRTRNIYVIIFTPSIIFSILHLLNPNVIFIGLFNIFLVGIMFSLMFYKRGSLWMPIGFHITWNFFQGNVFGFNVSGLDSYSIINNVITGNKLLTGGDFGAEGGLITTGVIFILTLAFIFLKRKEDPELWSTNM